MKKLILLVIFSLISVGAAAADPHAGIREALVLIVAKSTPDEGHIGAGQTDFTETFSSGFSVSDDGFIITTHHVLDKHIKTNGLRLNITAQFKESGAEALPVAVVRADPLIDLVLLKARLRVDETVPVVNLGDGNEEVNSSTRLFGSGFPAKSYLPKDGNFINDTGTLSFLNQVAFDAQGGHSGGPVYLEDGTVIGITKGAVRGEDGAIVDGKSVYIPIEFASNVLAFIRIKELLRENRDLQDTLDWYRSALGNMPKDIPEGRDTHSRLVVVEDHLDEIDSNFVWSANVVPASDKLVIQYRKLIGRKKKVAEIALSLTVDHNEYEPLSTDQIVYGKTQTVFSTRDATDFLKNVSLSADRTGTFELIGLSSILRPVLERDGVRNLTAPTARINELLLTVKGFDENGEEMLIQQFRTRCTLRQCLNR